MLTAWIDDFLERGGHAEALLGAFQRSTARLVARYPDCWFELGTRSDDAIEGLTNRAFTACARVPKGRFPFQDRTPFRTYVAEQFDDRAVGYHTFWARLSITRELLRDDYARNIRRDPVLRWRDQLHREIGKILPDIATLTPGGWASAATGPRRVLPNEEVIRQLRGESLPLAARVGRALTLLGRPIPHSQLTNLLADALNAPAPELGTEATEPTTAETQDIREAVLSAWLALDPDARSLLAALCRGDDYDAIIARSPNLRDRSAVSRAMRRISERFTTQVAVALGAEIDAVHATPRTLLEHVLDVLLPLVDDLETS
jgi:hypothetical protein